MSHAEIIHLNREALEVQKQHLRDAELCSDDPVLFAYYLALAHTPLSIQKLSTRECASELPTSANVTMGALP